MEQNQVIFKIKELCSSVTESTYEDLICEAYRLLVMLHDLGLSEEQVYQLFLEYHNTLEESIARDWVADILDYVCGWCDQQWYIWRSDGKFNRIK